MTQTEALERATETVGDRATVQVHRGERKHWGLRIKGTWQDAGQSLGVEVRDALGVQQGKYTGLAMDAGWVCVWVA